MIITVKRLHWDRNLKAELLTTDAVLLEIGNGLASYYCPQAVAIIEKLLNSPQIQIVHLTPSLFQEAFALYKQYQDKSWGLVDCSSFVVMKQYDIQTALSFDKHFAQAGFEIDLL
ncbi:MAG: PIN domain-containing protein [Methylococcales bacterium]